MRDRRTLTRTPSAPPLVRRGMTGCLVGVGLGGLACGGLTTGKNPDAEASRETGSNEAQDAGESADRSIELEDAADAASDGTVRDAWLLDDATDALPDLGARRDYWVPCGVK